MQKVSSESPRKGRAGGRQYVDAGHGAAGLSAAQWIIRSLQIIGAPWPRAVRCSPICWWTLPAAFLLTMAIVVAEYGELLAGKPLASGTSTCFHHWLPARCELLDLGGFQRMLLYQATPGRNLLAHGMHSYSSILALSSTLPSSALYA